MPEIGEVARIVAFIRKRLVGKTLAVVKAQHDENVFGKAGTSAAEFEKLAGKKIESAGQQGKYFWLIMSSPPHPVIHFGMAGWFKIRDEDTSYHKSSKPADLTWPPKHWKFTFETTEKPGCEAAFVDYRRFGRIRLIDCAGADIRRQSPLKDNGPDPVIDQGTVTEEWLAEKLAKKKVPIKALLLDQAVISGIGNWVGDEILYSARIHPEQYSNTLSDAQVSQLHKSLHYVISHAVGTLVEWDLFPETWLFKHRWDKGKKNSRNQLANGAKIEFVTVGGRTSALVPSVQKKTGPVAGDVEHEPKEEDDQEDEATEEDKEMKKSKGTSKKKAGSKGTDRPSISEKHETRHDNRVIPSVRKQVASSSKKDETEQEKSTVTSVKKRDAGASKANETRLEAPTKPSKAKRQSSNPSSFIDQISTAHINSTENIHSASKKRARKSEPEEDESAKARGQKKKPKDESTVDDLKPRRRSARLSNIGGKSE